MRLPAGPDLDLVPLVEDALEQGTADHAAPDVLPRDAGLVQVERTGDDHERGDVRVPLRQRERGVEDLDEGPDVDALLGRDRTIGAPSAMVPLMNVLDLVVVLDGHLLRDHVDLVLDDHDPLDPDELERHQVLLGLGLGAGLVRRDHQHGPVHQGRAREHGRHQGLVAGRVDERDRPERLGLAAAARAGRGRRICIAPLALRTAIERGVGVPEPDRDAPLDLLRVPVCPGARKRVHERRLPVVHMAHDSDINARDGYIIQKSRTSLLYVYLSYLYVVSSIMAGLQARNSPRSARAIRSVTDFGRFRNI